MSFGKKGITPQQAGPTRSFKPQPVRPLPAPTRSAQAAHAEEVIHTGAFATWSRVPAVIVDNLLGFGVPFVALATFDAFTPGFEIGAGRAIFWSLLASLAYHAGLESSSRQATLGKQMMGLVVTDAEGRRITTGRAILRNSVGRLADGFSPAYFGYLSVLMTAEKRAWHDFIAGTRVRSAASRTDHLAAAFA